MKQNHIHKYKRINMATKPKQYLVYACMLNCTHYIPEKLIRGKVSICWNCDAPFTIHLKDIAKPICDNCIIAKKEGNREIEGILKEIGVVE